jgi:hypothetical protein
VCKDGSSATCFRVPVDGVPINTPYRLSRDQCVARCDVDVACVGAASETSRLGECRLYSSLEKIKPEHPWLFYIGNSVVESQRPSFITSSSTTSTIASSSVTLSLIQINQSLSLAQITSPSLTLLSVSPSGSIALPFCYTVILYLGSHRLYSMFQLLVMM